MHPCCGQSLRRASFIVAILEIIFASVSAIFYILGLVAAGSYRSHKELNVILQNFRIPFFNTEVEHTAEEIAVSLRTIFGVALSFCLLDIGLSVLLGIAIKKKCVKLMKIWIGIRLLFLSMSLVYVLTILCSGYSTTGSFFGDISSICLRIYLLWVVHAYMIQLKEEIALKTSPSIIQMQGNVDISNFPL